MKCWLTTSKAATSRIAPLLIKRANSATQALDRFGQVVALGDQLIAAGQNLDKLVVGPQVDRAEPLAFLAQVLKPALDLDAAGQRRIGFMLGKRDEARRLTIQFGRDRVLEFFASHAGVFQPLVGRRALLARGAHRFERLTGCAVGVSQRSLAQRERVGGLLAR